MEKGIFLLVWECMLYIVKVLVGAIALATGVYLLWRIGAGLPVFGGYVSAGFNSDTLKELFDTAIDKLPFIPIVLKALKMQDSVLGGDSYSILHDFAKMMLLFVTTSAFTKIIGTSWVQLKKIEGGGALGLARVFQLTGDIVLAMLAIPTVIIYSCLIHEIFMMLWMRLAGNGALSNTCMYILVILLLLGIYYLLSGKLREGFLNMLVKTLLDFGLMLCAVAAFCFMRILISFNAYVDLSNELEIVIPFFLFVGGFAVLMFIKCRKRS